MADQIVSTHRVLIFAQLKSMLDIVESDLLRKDMPNVTYLRLDGSVCFLYLTPIYSICLTRCSTSQGTRLAKAWLGGQIQ